MSIDELREKYKDNEFILNKLETYLSKLPMLMQTIEEDHQKKTVQRQEVQNKKESFILDFLKQHSFYYIPSSETYIQKYEHAWKIIREDEIIHIVGSFIPKELLLSKYKLIQSILKKIKEKGLVSLQVLRAHSII